ncbi:hypothetical protein MC45_09325 [Sphingomonas taxi]|uniref:Uncharacterized protein n=1 Tax=Sphingomonas taxi TaxID=1549858 RepID=A0A097EG57_9SPHN|nr:hypothetical protein MC45_09325 [Sphingomonas taxi]
MPVAAADVELHERTGELILLPGCGMFAGPQPDDRIADADRLPGPQRQVATDAVALVEQADHGHPLCHRRATGRQSDVGGRDGLDALALVRLARREILYGDGAVGFVRPLPRAIAEHRGQPQHHQQDAGGEPASHHPSGVQAS